MSRQVKVSKVRASSSDSLAASTPGVATADSSSARQKWDDRYAAFVSKKRSRPTPFVIMCLPQLPIQGRALDIAAGAGRHSLALARHGLRVDAVDISWQGLRLAQQRARQTKSVPPGQIQFIVADIEHTWLLKRQYEVILVCFFLHRPLFPLIKKHLLPGGWLIYQTLTVEKAAPPGCRPLRRDFLLEPGELQSAFSDFEILFYDEGDYGDRTTAQLLAQKPAN